MSITVHHYNSARGGDYFVLCEPAEFLRLNPTWQHVGELFSPQWKPIDSAPKDGRELVVGFDCASCWIVRNAWYRDAAAVEEMRLCGDASADETDIGWWSYRHSVTQEMIEPTHWLCECPSDPGL